MELMEINSIESNNEKLAQSAQENVKSSHKKYVT